MSNNLTRAAGTTGHLVRLDGTTGHLMRGPLVVIYTLTAYPWWAVVYTCYGAMREENPDWNETTRTMTNIIQDGVGSYFYHGKWTADASLTYSIVATCYISADLSTATLTVTDSATLDTATAIATFTYSGSIALDEESGLIIGDLSLTSYSIDDADIEIDEVPITFDATSEDWESGAYVELAQV
jgi:hypothetical protein